MKIIAVFVVLLSFGDVTRAAWTPNATNSMDWTVCGVRGDIPTVSTIATTLSPIGGGSDDAAQINSAIAACASNQVVKLSTGTFTISSASVLLTKDGVVLRGSGTNTILELKSNRGVYLGGSQSIVSDTAISSGATLGSTSMVVSSSANISVGDLIAITANGDTNLVWRNTGTAPMRTMGNTVRVMTVSGTTIEFWPSLVYNFMDTSGGAGSPTVYRIPFASVSIFRKIGIEDLLIDADDAGAPTDAINMVSSYDCWMRGVTVYNPANRHILLTYCANITLRSNSFLLVQGHAANTLGVGIEESSCFNLIEDNILYQCNIVCENGRQMGNVIAYNYVSDAYQTGFGQYNGLWFNHSFHVMRTLIEGNIANGATSDGVHGSASHNMIFRNFLSGWTPTMRETNGNAIQLCRWSLHNSIVCNVIGMSNYPNGTMQYQPTNSGGHDGTIYYLGYISSGNASFTTQRPPDAPLNPGEDTAFDRAVTNTTFRHFNFDHATFSTISNGVDDIAMPASLYLTAKPLWFGSLNYPPIGPDVSTVSEGATNSARVEITNPARERFFGRLYSEVAVTGTRGIPLNIRLRP